MSGVISWEDPPNARSVKAQFADLVDELKERPGEWALVAHDVDMGEAEKVRQGLRRDNGFQVRRRSTVDGHDVYVRFVEGDVSE